MTDKEVFAKKITRRDFLKLFSVLPISYYEYFEKRKIKEIREFLTNRERVKDFVALQVGVNDCGPSTIATIFNLFGYLYRDSTKRVSPEDIKRVFAKNNNKYFDAHSKTVRNFRQPNGTMIFYDLICAYKMFKFETVPIFGARWEEIENERLVDYGEIDSLMLNIKGVFDGGGVIVNFSTLYNGHFFILTDFEPVKDKDNRTIDAQVFVIDGKGRGFVGGTTIKKYAPEMIGLVGILPGKGHFFEIG